MQVRVRMDADFDVLSDNFAEQTHFFLDQGVQIDFVRFENLSTGKGEELPCQFAGAQGLLANLVKAIVSAAVRGHLIAAHLRPAQNRADHIIEVVGDSADKAGRWLQISATAARGGRVSLRSLRSSASRN